MFKVILLAILPLATAQVVGLSPVIAPVAPPGQTLTNAPFIAPGFISPAPTAVETLGPATGKSCAERTGAICKFDREECCNPGDQVLTVGGPSESSCSDAKTVYSTLNSTRYTFAQCESLQENINSGAGSACACVVEQGPAPILGPCYSRANASLFKPCQFLPETKTGCCPDDVVYNNIQIPWITIDVLFMSCYQANLSMSTVASTNWTDSMCADIKKGIEAEAFYADGCVCPGSERLNSTAPSGGPIQPTIAPTMRPTFAPTMSGSSTMPVGAAILVVLAFFF